jgi:hypothetical protein
MKKKSFIEAPGYSLSLPVVPFRKRLEEFAPFSPRQFLYPEAQEGYNFGIFFSGGMSAN